MKTKEVIKELERNHFAKKLDKPCDEIFEKGKLQ